MVRVYTLAMADAAPDWAAALPPPPFAAPRVPGEPARLSPLSPRVAVLLIAALIVGVLLWLARDSVRPFIVGLLFVYLLDIPVRFLVRYRIRRSISILIVYAVTAFVLVEFLAITLTPLIDEIGRFIQDLPQIAEQLNVRMQELSKLYSRLEIPVAVREWIDSVIAGLGSGIGAGGVIDLSFLLPLVTGAGNLIGTLFGYLILPVWVFYLLKDRVTLVAAFDRSLPDTWRFDTLVVLRTIERVFGQWVRAQLVLGITVGITTFVGLLVLSRFVDPVFGRYALLLSIIAGVLELLPIIGPILAAIPAVLLAATAGVEAVIASLVLYTLIQQLENYFLVPKIQGDAVQLHPAAVMFAIIIGGALAGLLGAILALPVAAAIRDVVRYLFHRLGPDDPSALARLIDQVRMRPEPTPAAAAGAEGADV